MNGPNEELQKELTELVRQRAAISEVLRAIASSPHDLQPIFDTIILSGTHLSRGNVGILRLSEGKTLRRVAHPIHPNTLLQRWSPPMLLEPTSSSWDQLASGSPIHAPDVDVAHDAFFQDPAVAAVIKGTGCRTLLAVPLIAEKRLIGVLSILRVRLEPFAGKEIELILDFAAQAAIALQITRRERQLREMQMELAHANRVATMGQLTASIAHEMQQPVAATVLNAQAALRFFDVQTVDQDEVRQILKDIVTDGNRAGEIISRIRDLVKKAPPQWARFELNGAVREVVELTRGEAMKNGVTVQTELPDNLPHIQGDRVQLQQVILNLIVNAIQAMSGLTEGVRELHIDTESAGAQGVRVAVRDTGPGLSAENLQRLFEPFYTTKESGMGMGLSICRTIIEDHGGRLWATGLQPHGALFQFTIPAR
jgi:signal transduction histidine kinase